MAATGYLLRSATGRTITEAGGLPWIEGDLGITGPTVVGTTHKTEFIPGASTIAIPGGAVAGDLAILIVSGNDGDASLDAAFTQVGSKAVTDTTTESIVGKRTLTGADIIAGTLPIVGPPSYNIADYTLWVLHSASGTPVVDAAVSYTSSDAGITDPTILTFPAATASGTNNTVIVATGGRNTFTGWSSPPGDVTPDYTTAGIWNGHFDQPASGSTGTRTVSTADAYARWTSWTIVVKHPSGGVATVSSTETASGTDTGSLAAGVPSSDTGTAAEGTPSIRLTGTESAAGTDAGVVAASTAGTETASGSESSSIATSSTDAGTATDATALTVAVGSSDTASGADTASVGGSSAPTSSDPATGTDAGTVTASTPSSDTATGTDAGSVVATTTTGEVAAGADGATVLVLVASLDVAAAADAASVANDDDTETGSVVLSVAAATAVLSAAAASVVLSVVAASATLTATGD